MPLPVYGSALIVKERPDGDIGVADGHSTRIIGGAFTVLSGLAKSLG